MPTTERPNPEANPARTKTYHPISVPNGSPCYAVLFRGGKAVVPGLCKEVMEDYPYGVDLDMPCGHTYHFTTDDAALGKDIPCPCGREDHWFLKFRED